MGSVVKLKLKRQPRLPEPELGLMNRLIASSKVLRRGGWAARGEPNGVVILRDGERLGVWTYWGERYHYTTAELDLPRFRGGVRSWDQGIWSEVVVSSS